MMTVFASPTHVIPQELEMPVLMDQIGGGAQAFRRRYIRPLSSWQLEIPGKQERTDPILGLLQYAQGDTPIWFDGAGFGEVTEPIVFAEGTGTITDYPLPHRHVFIASLVIYNNGGVYPNWIPLGGDGISTCDAIRYDSALGNGYIGTAKYRRRVKCVVNVEEKVTRRRVFRSSFTADNIETLLVTLKEVAV